MKTKILYTLVGLIVFSIFILSCYATGRYLGFDKANAPVFGAAILMCVPIGIVLVHSLGRTIVIEFKKLFKKNSEN